MVGGITRYLRLGISIPGCGSVWGTVASDLVKAAKLIVVFSSQARGGDENIVLATLALLITSVLTTIASIAYLLNTVGACGSVDAPPLAIITGRLISLVIFIVLAGAKALREIFSEIAPEQATQVAVEPVSGSFDQDFSSWTNEHLTADVLSMSAALHDFSWWASFKGPHQVPKQEAFGKALTLPRGRRQVQLLPSGRVCTKPCITQTAVSA